MINKEHKDRLFSFLFGQEENKSWTLSLYNGTASREDEVLRLSDAFPRELDASQSDVEVRVRMLNINHGRNRKLMEACRLLSEYTWFVEEIRRNKKGMGIEEAVDKAIDDMPVEFKIRKCLIGNRAEVKDMCITEYNEAETMQMFKEKSYRKDFSFIATEKFTASHKTLYTIFYTGI